MENLSWAIKREVDFAVKDLAHSAFATIQSQAHEKLHSTKNDYLSGLKLEEVGENSYIIYLEGDWANSLEDGFNGFDIAKGILASPKAKTAQAGHKYQNVPLPPQKPQGGTMSDALKGLKGVNTVSGIEQRLTKVFKDPAGNPMQGKVAVSTTGGITKYQRQHPKSIQSIYIAYRTVSEKGKEWLHPGFEGIKAFEEAEKQLVKNIEQIVRKFS